MKYYDSDPCPCGGDHERGPVSDRHCCPQGHEYDDENTIIGKSKRGGQVRRCKTCVYKRREDRRTYRRITEPEYREKHNRKMRERRKRREERERTDKARVLRSDLGGEGEQGAAVA